MVSLIIPPGDQISRVNKMLTDEAGTASNIKSRVNRLSVLGAITSAQQKLKQYNKVPPNGLVIYCGEVLNEQGTRMCRTFRFGLILFLSSRRKGEEDVAGHGAAEADQHIAVHVRQPLPHRGAGVPARVRPDLWLHRHGRLVHAVWHAFGQQSRH
jgi:hypothetical protein